MSDTASQDANATPAAAEVIRLAARAYERDRYLSALLAPRSVRADLVTLAAFAGEIARLPGFVTDPTIGEIRMQWWRDAIAAEPGAPPTGHPIADGLRAAIARHDLPVEPLQAFIDAHADRLAEAPFSDTTALMANLDAGEGALFAVAARMLGAGRDGGGRLVVSAARAYGLARLLFELPVTLAEGRCLLPTDSLPSASDARAHILRDVSQAPDAARHLATTARTELEAVRAGWHRAPASVRLAVLPVALVTPYLRASQVPRSGAAGVPDIVPLSRVWRLWKARRFGLG